ncbi:unnamed protein product [Rotaria sp. Silwood2]|nr:unnamed protein product [Rotaria sp. Silwood2]CAF4685404.1 unnamed protein product [Rotaria sp. Silwood2]
MAAVARKQEVITRLTTCYSDLTDDAAGRIYDEAMNLYHESLAYTNFYLLLKSDEKIISALFTIIIFEIDLDKPNELHGQIMMFILFSYKKIDPTYVFVQAIGYYAQHGYPLLCFLEQIKNWFIGFTFSFVQII